MEINVIDVEDPRYYKRNLKDLRSYGKNPIILAGMCNGVAQMVTSVKARAGSHGRITLLKIHSHGAGGLQNISAGKSNGISEYASISNANFTNIEFVLSELTPYFAKPAQVYLMGCSVAGNSDGRKLIQKLSDLWKVSVVAGRYVQFSGSGENTLKLEGPTLTASPGGKEARNTGSYLPTFAQLKYHIQHGF